MNANTHDRFQKYAWFTLGFTIVVILWGALVRITGSGAGCGSHWPTCNGVIVPVAPSFQTIIEFTHRATSGLSLVCVVLLVVFSFRLFPKGARIRWFASWSLFFIIVEALIGAGLVLFELVGNNDSLMRAVVISLHLANTMLLVICLTACAYLASFIRGASARTAKASMGFYWLVFVALVLTGASGAIVALGDTLFPSATLLEGLRADFSPEAHILIRLRVYHPFIAVVSVVALFVLMYLRRQMTPRLEKLRFLTTLVCIAQLMLGLLNVVMLAPMGLQLAHLGLANLLIVLFGCYWAEALYGAVAYEFVRKPGAAGVEPEVGRSNLNAQPTGLSS